MPNPSQAIVDALYSYPIKGLSPASHETVNVTPGQTLPFDRAYAIENGPGRFDPFKPQHLPKIAFLMLMRDERLATLKTTFDPATTFLTIERDGKQVARGQLSTPIGRQMIEQFLAAYMQANLRGAPRIVSAKGHSFSDVAEKCVHIVNRASIQDFERFIGRPLDPLRFRANIYIEGLKPWQELDWIDKTIRIGDIDLDVYKRTQRCPATNVNPQTATRDLDIPAALQRHKGHMDFGIYAKIATAGSLSKYDTVAW